MFEFLFPMIGFLIDVKKFKNYFKNFMIFFSSFSISFIFFICDRVFATKFGKVFSFNWIILFFFLGLLFGVFFNLRLNIKLFLLFLSFLIFFSSFSIRDFVFSKYLNLEHNHLVLNEYIFIFISMLNCFFIGFIFYDFIKQDFSKNFILIFFIGAIFGWYIGYWTILFFIGVINSVRFLFLVYTFLFIVLRKINYFKELC